MAKKINTIESRKIEEKAHLPLKEDELDTLPKVLLSNYHKHPKQRSIRFKDFGLWNTLTREDYYNHVKYFALGLTSMGFGKGDKLVILGENQPQWYWGELAAQSLGGASVGIFIDCLPPEIEYIFNHSDATFAIAHDQEQVDKFLEIKDELPLLKKIIYWDPKGLWFYDDPSLVNFEQVEKLGMEFEKEHPGFFEESTAQGRGEDTAILSYTSGTTGLPKGAIICNKALVGMSRNWCVADPWLETYNYLSYLSPAWVTEQLLGVSGTLTSGAIVNFPEDPETIQENIREVGPQIIFYSARLWESLNATIHVKIEEARWWNRFLYRLFSPIGEKIAELNFEKKKISLWWKLIYKIADLVVFRPLRDKVGLLKVRYAYSAGAALSPDIIRFFHAIGINLKQCYGLTETSINTVHRDGDIKPETSGTCLPNNEVKISPEGEILIKSKYLFSGYYKSPEAFKEKVDDEGWFHTADFGYLEEDGGLVIIDRMQDLKELKGGRKFSPQYIEIRLRFSPYIKDALIIGGADNEYVTAIITIDLDNVGKWAERHHLPYTTFMDLSQKDEVSELILKDIIRVNNYLPEWSRIRKFVSLHKEFDPDEAELTRTRKLKRDLVEQRYNYIIDGLYADIPVINAETAVVYRDGRKGTIKTAVKVRSVEEG